MSRSVFVSDQVRDYVQRWGAREHPVLARCREETAAMSNASMQISCEQGAFMQTMVAAIHARRALEVGVFTGYSSTAMALAMQAIHGDDALVMGLDVSEEYTAKARGYWKAAGVDHVVQLRIGPAADTMKHMLAEGDAESFDLMFIDADKTGYDAYYELGLELLRSGGLMLIDNMLWGGDVADPSVHEPAAEALRALARKIHDDKRVDMTLATVGDGLSLVVKR
jgi:predicted O-methyltransferase YrrM